MRFTRILLLLVAAAAIAGVAVPSASALAFDDNVCPFATGTLIKVCPQGSTGKAYSTQLQGRNGTGCVPYVNFKAIGALPTGLSLSSSGLISGTPTQTGEWTFWVGMQDIPASDGGISWCSDNKSTEEQFRITVVQGLKIVQAQSLLTPGQVGSPYNLQFTATGGNPTWTVSSGSLPAGLNLSSGGLLTGAPTATGDFNFKITATDGARSDTQTYAMTVVEPLKLTTGSTVGEVGIAFQLTPQPAGGRPGYSWSLDGGTSLPAGLTMDSATGAINGKPAVAGAYTVTLKLTDSLGLTTIKDLHLTVAARLLITRKPLAAAKVGKKYRIFLRATGGVTPRGWIMLGGRPGLLPAGLKLNARTGQISGTPRKAGTYRLRLQVADKLGAHSAAGFVLKVRA